MSALDWPDFGYALWKVDNELGLKPEWVLPVLYLESRFDPAAMNPSGCVGLNQFCVGPGTYARYVNVPIEQYRQWPASSQLAGPIFNYWRDALRSGRIDSAARLMVAQLGHSLLTTTGDGIVLAAPSAEYYANAGVFDPPTPDYPKGKGYFTLGDIAGVLAYDLRQPVVQDALSRAYNARQRPPAPPRIGPVVAAMGALALAAGAAYAAHEGRRYVRRARA